MKKFLIFLGTLLIIFSGFVIYNNYFFNKIPVLDIEDDKVYINKLYVYGTHLNMEGNYNFFDDGDLVLYDGEFIEYQLNYIDDANTDGSMKKIFNLSDYTNDGIYLDDIDIGDYYLFFRVKDMTDDTNLEDSEIKYKYYPVINNTEYKETIYYTMSNFNKKIIINSEESYPTMMIHVDKNKNREIYDVVLDPGHGGIDGGANKDGYEETDFTMDIALKVKNKLENYGFKVKLTHNKGQLSDKDRLEEYGIHGRAVVSKEVNAKYLFSFHLNSSESSKVNGLEIYTAKNINYDFAKMLVNNITSLTGIGYSTNKINKIDNSIYSRNFTEKEVNSSIKNYQDNNLIPYDISTNSNYYYMIRETGGIVTGAYVDDRNKDILSNPYTKSNIGTEAYLLELGYISNKNDLNNMVNNMDKYVDAITNSIKSLYNDNYK